MKKIILLTVVLLFSSVLVNAQNAFQEFHFNGTLGNTTNTILFSGTAKYVKDRVGNVNSALGITNDVFEVSIPNLPLYNSQRTISVWVKYNDITRTNYILGYGSLANAQYFGLLQQGTTTSKSDLNLASWGSTNDVVVSTTIALGIWYNYTVTYDGLTSKIYRNGKLIKSAVCPRKLTSGVNFVIGKMGTAIGLNADIDDLKIYDVALTANEVANLYNSDSVLASNESVAIPVNSRITAKKTNEVLSIMNGSKKSEIYSTEGVKVLSGENGIDISTLPEGTYLLKITDSPRGSTSQRLTAN